MNDSYRRFFTLLWKNEYCRFLSQAGREGVAVRWGGHNQNTCFSHFGVSVGDYIFPIRVYRGQLFVISCMHITKLTTRVEYLSRHPLDELLILHDCANEVLEGDSESPIRFGRAMSSEMLEQLRFTSRRGERALKYLENGRLVRSVSLQGVYQLTPTSAESLRVLLGE